MMPDPNNINEPTLLLDNLWGDDVENILKKKKHLEVYIPL